MKTPLSLKSKLLEMCTNPSLTYESQTWATTQEHLNKIYRTQQAMECGITGTKHRVRSSKVRVLTGTKNMKYIIKKLKLK